MKFFYTDKNNKIFELNFYPSDNCFQIWRDNRSGYISNEQKPDLLTWFRKIDNLQLLYSEEVILYAQKLFDTLMKNKAFI